MTRRWPALALALAGCAHTPETAADFDSLVLGALPRQSVGKVPFAPERMRGKVVLVTFVTTWCFPCLTDLVTLKKLEELYGSQGFVNVLVGMDREGAKVLEPFALGYDLSCVVVADERLRSGETPYGRVRELPSRLLFGRDGKVVVAYTGVADYAALERHVVAALK